MTFATIILLVRNIDLLLDLNWINISLYSFAVETKVHSCCNLNILCFPRAVISREETIFITRYQLWSELASFAQPALAGPGRGGYIG